MFVLSRSMHLAERRRPVHRIVLEVLDEGNRANRLRRLTGEIRGFIDASAAFVLRELRIRTQRPCTIDDSIRRM